jgi:hypothetical protein
MISSRTHPFKLGSAIDTFYKGHISLISIFLPIRIQNKMLIQMVKDLKNTLRIFVITVKYPQESMDLAVLRLSHIYRCASSGHLFFTLYFFLGFIGTDGFLLIFWVLTTPFFPKILLYLAGLNIVGYAMSGIGEGLDLKCSCLLEDEKVLLISGEEVLHYLERKIGKDELK